MTENIFECYSLLFSFLKVNHLPQADMKNPYKQKNSLVPGRQLYQGKIEIVLA